MLDSTNQYLFQKTSAVAGVLDERLGDLDLERTKAERWDGERLYLEYTWGVGGLPPVALLRLQVHPVEKVIWIGWLEIHPDYRGNGVGSRLVLLIEQAAQLGWVESLRLFSRRRAAGFWEKIGFIPEHDPRYFRKDTVLVGSRLESNCGT